MKILITGGNGQLAFDCNEILKKKHEVLSRNHKEMDISDFKQTESIISICNPDIILNCAAHTKVDDCETEKDLAREVNAIGPKNLAEISEKLDCKIIQISTDYVFNGKKNLPAYYVEDDSPDPLTYYGSTKLDGELAIQKATNSYAIIRTAWLYGLGGHNFLKTILKLCLKNPPKGVKVVNDQFGSITWTFKLALQIEKIIETDGQGIYHATSEGYSTWFEAAEYFLKKMEIQHKLIPCITEEYPTPASRPANSILENKRLKQEGINLMSNWENDLEQFVSKFRERLIRDATETNR
tara:strand:- start:43 stop:930 length:888 start_codon:yes stop_codon:yes gene_type:complete